MCDNCLLGGYLCHGMLAEQDDLTMEEKAGPKQAKKSTGARLSGKRWEETWGGGGGYTNVTNAKDKGGMCI